MNFLQRFKNNIEFMGKDGVLSLLKRSSSSPINPINEDNFNHNNKPNNNNRANNIRRTQQINNNNNTNNYNTFIYSRNNNNNNCSTQFPNRFNHNDDDTSKSHCVLLKSNISKDKMNNRYLCDNVTPNRDNTRRLFKNNSMKIIGNNLQNIVDHGYTPYNLKDYKKIDLNIRLGKLGANIGSKDWNERHEKINKMKFYSHQLNPGALRKGRGMPFNNRNQLPNIFPNRNGKFNKAKDYSDGLQRKNFNRKRRQNSNEDKEWKRQMEEFERFEYINSQRKYRQNLERIKFDIVKNAYNQRLDYDEYDNIDDVNNNYYNNNNYNDYYDDNDYREYSNREGYNNEY